MGLTYHIQKQFKYLQQKHLSFVEVCMKNKHLKFLLTETSSMTLVKFSKSTFIAKQYNRKKAHQKLVK